MKSLSFSSLATLSLFYGLAHSSPAPLNLLPVVKAPAASPSASKVVVPDSLQAQLSTAVAAYQASGVSGPEVIAAYKGAVGNLSSTKAQQHYQDAIAVVESAFSNSTASPKARSLEEEEIVDDVALEKRQTIGIDSYRNVNPRNPATPIYPKKSPQDAPYSVSENDLRSAIYIPSTFQYGAGSKQPVILIPGTAGPAGTVYINNLIPLLTASNFGDPVWVNIPGYSLGDAQVNAEYVAYAINYIYGITGRNPAVVTFSQGSIDTQWAMKYWPSTRTNVTDIVSLSPDWHGTVLAYILCPTLALVGCTPSIYQQTYESNFIRTLRSNGGDSAYVPTTTVYSETDEVVQPQQGVLASGFIQDARGVGASNNDIQLTCPLQPAGGIYLHEGVLFNALAWALLEDALTHDGPGQASRLNLRSVCAQPFAPGLTVANVAGTEATDVNEVVNVLTYFPKVFQEPPIKAYAARG